ncbi:MAG: response regulator, partial [Deltaproteobacteria bacterium]|nr:response regulator [Deltaproteobacteria bacterium]
MLSLEGYTIMEAVNGAAALESMAKDAPDIVLMDLQMPVMGGLEAMGKIKEEERYKGIPVVALTASAMMGDEEKILAQGFDGYVPKPIELSKLLGEVSRVLKQA